MSTPVTITTLDVSQVKRVHAVALAPTPSGLTVIGGKNGQGKTSVLDAIAWAMGGDKLKPSSPQNAESVQNPTIKLTLSNGLVVERSGKNSSLKVTDPSGNKAGQTLLDSFIGTFALNLPKFMQASEKEKALILLDIIGVGDQLQELERKEKELYNERLIVGREADRKEHFAEEMPHHPNVPPDLISANDLLMQHQAILAKNAENQRLRGERDNLKFQLSQEEKALAMLQDRLQSLLAEIEKQKTACENLSAKVEIAEKNAADIQDESTEAIQAQLDEIELTNAKIRDNLNKEAAFESANVAMAEYNNLTSEIELIRKAKIELLNGANLPLPGLSVEDGKITYNGQQWDCMSSSEQLRVATAIARSLQPKCGFVLVDKLEQMDLDTLREYSEWAAANGLQVIGTRVSTGSECSIIIENGYGKVTAPAVPTAPPVKVEKPWLQAQ